MSYLLKVLFSSAGWLYFRAIHRRRFKVLGKKGLPRENKILFYSNHLTMLDPFLILFGFFPLIIFKPNCLPLTLAAEENFLPANCKKVPVIRKIPFIRNLPLMRWALAHFCIPVKQGRRDARALKQAITKMKKEGRSILIFPEGHRAKGKELDKFQEGIATLYYLSQPTAVIPIKILGAEKILPIGKQWPDWSKGKICIIFGESISQKLDQIKKEGGSSQEIISSRIIETMREELIKLEP